ncbi:328_t:CDS:2, partial [Ambispora leptoticha]
MTIKEFGNSFKENNSRKEDIKKGGGNTTALNDTNFFTNAYDYKPAIKAIKNIPAISGDNNAIKAIAKAVESANFVNSIDPFIYRLVTSDEITKNLSGAGTDGADAIA